MRDRKGQWQHRTVMLSMVGMVVCLAVGELASSNQPLKSSEALAANRSQGASSLESDPFEYFKQGQAYSNEGKYEKAIDAFNEAESRGARFYELFVFRGYAYHEIREFQKAKRDAEKAIVFQPARMLGYELLAGVALAMGSFNDAIAVLTNGITKVEGIERAKLIKARGRFLLNREQQEDAIRDLTRATELGDISAVTYYLRGDAYRELGRYELAIQDYSEALKIQSSHAPSLRNRGWVYDCTGDLEKSLADFNQLLARFPEDLLTRRMRGWVRIEIGDKDGALADLSYALERGSKDSWTFLNAAAAYSLHENTAKALEVNGQGLALKDPDSEYALQFQRGLLLLISGQEAEARAFYKKAGASALKKQDPLDLQVAIAELKEEMNFHPHIAGVAESILKELEHVLTKTKAPHKPRRNQCQQFKKESEAGHRVTAVRPVRDAVTLR